MPQKSALKLFLFAMALASSLASAKPEDPAERLARPLAETSLNSRARGLLESAMAEFGIEGDRIEDAIKLQVVSHEWVVYRGHWQEVQQYLGKHHLRLGLTAQEIEHYREHGALPPPHLDSLIEALELAPAYTLALHDNQIHTLADVLNVRRKRNGDLLVPGLGKMASSEIIKAMLRLGFKMQETDSHEGTRDEAWKNFEELSVKTLKALSKAGINSPEQLLTLTEFEIEQVSGLGPQEVMEIGVFFHNRNRQLYDSILDRSIAEWRPLDLSLSIYPAARISPALRHHLNFIGVEVFADLLNFEKMSRNNYKPLQRKHSAELKGLIEKFYKALEPTLEGLAHVCGMALQ